MAIEVFHGDCLEIVPQLVARGRVVDSICCDPPYGINFMNRSWDDGIAFRSDTWKTIATILRPGGFLVAFGGCRTHHRMTCAIEDAGFVIQDCLMFLFGVGFPKNKSQLKPSYEPIVLAYKPGGKRTMQIDECRIGTGENLNGGAYSGGDKRRDDATPYFTGTQAGEYVQPTGRWPANLVHDGSEEVTEAFPDAPTGGRAWRAGDVEVSNWRLNEGSSDPKVRSEYLRDGDTGSAARFFMSCPLTEEDQWNREPANFAAACSNLQSAAAVSVLRHAAGRSILAGALSFAGYRAQDTSVTERELESVCDSVTGTIQSFGQRFLRGLPLESITVTSGHAKCVATPERTDTMMITIKLWTSGGFADRATFNITLPNMEPGDLGSVSRFHYSGKAGSNDRFGSRHPTIKPISLMKHLVALVTPPGGLVLDCFAGSGTTGVAALATGRDCILIEREEQYLADIKERLAFYEGGGTHSVQAKARNRAAHVREGDLFATPSEPRRKTGDLGSGWDKNFGGYDPVADGILSHDAALSEIARRVRSGEEKVPDSGYFGRATPEPEAAE